MLSLDINYICEVMGEIRICDETRHMPPEERNSHLEQQYMLLVSDIPEREVKVNKSLIVNKVHRNSYKYKQTTAFQ